MLYSKIWRSRSIRLNHQPTDNNVQPRYWISEGNAALNIDGQTFQHQGIV
jgi:hypothetical protein